MKMTIFALLGSSFLAVLLLGCQGKSYSDEELGLRKSTIFNENAQIEAYNYEGKVAGESTLIERAFENAPPMIPHSVDDMLPITQDNNACVACHAPEMAEAMNATAMPKSHFYNFRTNKDLGAQMDESRFNCVICHTTQVDAPPLVENKFTPNFRKDNGESKSNLLDVLNEGVK